ncbi:MAG: hypothetical protein ACYDAN_09575 [Candidatus Limnocylindrales bacterium]
MTRALVVHHDIDLADQEVESLRRLGYVVEQCSGPTASTCPVLNGGACQLAAECDVLVYDAWASGDSEGSARLIEGLRRLHPRAPIVLTFSGMGIADLDDAPERGIVTMFGQPTGANLDAAIKRAIASLGPVAA